MPPRPARDAEASRARIFEAAKIRFSRGPYEGVGVRDIAADARVDPALVIRYFGSKAELFRAIAAQAFGTDELLRGGVERLAESSAEVVLADFDDRSFRGGYDPFRLLLASIGSPVAGPILATYLEKDFVGPLAEAIGGEDASERGMLLAAQIVGVALLRVASASRGKRAAGKVATRRLFLAMARALTGA